MERQSGFTLIEIAIVLVIIGLLLGGMLKGQALIDNSKIRSLRSEFDGVAAAVQAYQDRYHHLPGDDPRATRWTAATAGDGDGGLESAVDAFDTGTMGAHERRYFWQHLRHAGFLVGDPSDTTHPRHAFGGQLGAVTGNGTSPLGLTGPVVLCASGVPLKAAEAIDIQMDDGVPQTGSVRAQATGATTDPGDGTTTASDYSESSGETYALCKVL